LGDLDPAQRTRLFRRLYGWQDKSQYGRYEYQRRGLLGKIGYVPIIRGVFIVKAADKKKVLRFFRGKAKVISREIILREQDITLRPSWIIEKLHYPFCPGIIPEMLFKFIVL